MSAADAASAYFFRFGGVASASRRRAIFSNLPAAATKTLRTPPRGKPFAVRRMRRTSRVTIAASLDFIARARIRYIDRDGSAVADFRRRRRLEMALPATVQIIAHVPR